MNRPCFKGRPIASIEALARTLHVSPRYLWWVVERTDRLYRPMKPIIKPDGGVRQTYNPAAPLKDVQRRINRNIFSRVEFPIYLQGGIRDRKTPRHCVANAQLHTNAAIVINEDIAGFFPSVTQQQVQDVWQHFFRFPPAIAKTLSALTTYDGALPQGAPTSSYIANLVLWKQEPVLVAQLAALGICYSRYVDDITVSSRRFLGSQQKADVIGHIRRLCNANGFKVKRRKQRIETSGRAMSVNNLQVNRRVTLSGAERARIRAAVKACEQYPDSLRHSDEYKTLFNSTTGRVNWLRRFHRKEGERMAQRLILVKPAATLHA